MPIALLPVSDKTGLLPFAQALVKNHGYKLLSTGGTSKMLRDAGLPVRGGGAKGVGKKGGGGGGGGRGGQGRRGE